MFGKLGDRDGIEGVRVGDIFGVAEFGAVVADQNAVAKEIGQLRQRLADVAGADDKQSWFGIDGFHKDLHCAAANARIATGRIRERIFQGTRLPIGEGGQRLGYHAGFHFTAADGVLGAAAGEDEHLGTRPPRHGAAGADDGAERGGFAASLQLSEAGVDAVPSGARDRHGGNDN